MGGYRDARDEAQYLISLQWSVAHLTQGSAFVTAHSYPEKIYSLLVLSVGFLVSAAFVSSITTSMTRLQIIGSQQQVEFSKLRRYLRHHGVYTKLAVLINRSAKRAATLRQHNVTENDIQLLTFLSEPLRMELHFDVHGRVLWSHPLLQSYVLTSAEVMRQVCHTAVKVKFASASDVLFNRGDKSMNASMLFVMGGVLEYS